MQFTKLNGGAVECLNRRYASTNLHGIASQTTVVIIFVITVIFTVRFVMQTGTILNKIDTAVCDVVATVLIGLSNCCVYGNVQIFYLLNEINFTSHIYMALHNQNYCSMNISNSQLFHIICDRHTLINDVFLFPILIIICLQLPLIIPPYMQLFIFSLSPCTDAVTLNGTYSSHVLR